MKPLPTLWTLCALGFLALGCQAGRLQWAGSDYSDEQAALDSEGSPNMAQNSGGAEGSIYQPAGYEEGPGRPLRVPPVKVAYGANCWPTSECVVWMKYHNRAANAYQRCRRQQGPASHDYRVGFEKGYMDLAQGGLGRTPATAPHKYWGPAYRTPAGHDRQQEWLAGYTAGTEMAYEDGLGQFYPVSPNSDAQFYRNDTPSWAMRPAH